MEYYANEGYVFKSLVTGEVLGNYLCLGINDRIDNYEQILKPEPTPFEPPTPEPTVEERLAVLQSIVDDFGLTLLTLDGTI